MLICALFQCLLAYLSQLYFDTWQCKIDYLDHKISHNIKWWEVFDISFAWLALQYPAYKVSFARSTLGERNQQGGISLGLTGQRRPLWCLIGRQNRRSSWTRGVDMLVPIGLLGWHPFTYVHIVHIIQIIQICSHIIHLHSLNFRSTTRMLPVPLHINIKYTIPFVCTFSRHASVPGTYPCQSVPLYVGWLVPPLVILLNFHSPWTFFGTVVFDVNGPPIKKFDPPPKKKFNFPVTKF